MNSLLRTGLCAVLTASLLSGCVIVIGNEDDFDDDLVYTGDYEQRDSFSSGGYVSENVLTDVRSRFNDDALLREEPILISASDGVVTLSGEVDSTRLVERAVDVASSTPGVDSVVLKMVVTVD